jgi:hypothetical protein
MKWPALLTGSIPLATWLNALLESARSCQIAPGYGYKIKSRSSSGTVLEIVASGGSSTSQEAALVLLCITDASHPDHLVCQDLAGTSYLVAKAARFRGSLTTETVDSTTLTYTGWSNNYNQRTESDGVNTQTMVLTPRYQAATSTSSIASATGIVCAMSIAGSFGTGVSAAPLWMEVTPARFWVQKYGT